MSAWQRARPRIPAGVKDDFYDLVHSVGSRQFWQTIALMVVGLTLYSVGINALLVPHKFISTGATGLALLIYYGLGAPSVGVIYWLINIPILLVGWRTMSMKFVVMALIGVFISGLLIELTGQVRIPASDPLMAAILAGVLTGGGCGLYLRYGGSAGGIDIVAAVVRRKFGVPMGTTFIAVNAVNFVVGGIIGGRLDLAFYSAVAMATHARVLDRMQAGFSSRKAALIVTTRPTEVADLILRRLGRGCTFLEGAGGMSQKSCKVIYTVINLVELARLKELIFHTDAHAFVTVTDVAEVIGKRFLSWSSQGLGGGHGRPRPAVAVPAAGDPPPPPG